MAGFKSSCSAILSPCKPKHHLPKSCLPILEKLAGFHSQVLTIQWEVNIELLLIGNRWDSCLFWHGAIKKCGSSWSMYGQYTHNKGWETPLDSGIGMHSLRWASSTNGYSQRKKGSKRLEVSSSLRVDRYYPREKVDEWATHVSLAPWHLGKVPSKGSGKNWK